MTTFVSAESIQPRPTQSLADSVSYLESLERELSVSDKTGDQLNVRSDSTVCSGLLLLLLDMLVTVKIKLSIDLHLLVDLIRRFLTKISVGLLISEIRSKARCHQRTKKS